jgi:hypothetical protein
LFREALVSLPVKARWLAIGAATLLLATCGASVLGSIVLIDEGGQIASMAVVASNGASQQLTRLAGGVFIGIARVEGELAIRCRDGAEHRRGYITPHLNEWSAIPRGEVCAARRQPEGINLTNAFLLCTPIFEQ